MASMHTVYSDHTTGSVEKKIRLHSSLLNRHMHRLSTITVLTRMKPPENENPGHNSHPHFVNINHFLNINEVETLMTDTPPPPPPPVHPQL